MKDLNRIKVVLTEKNLTQVWLAEKMNKGEKTISLWCTNRKQPSLENLDQIAILLKVDISELLKPTQL